MITNAGIISILSKQYRNQSGVNFELQRKNSKEKLLLTYLRNGDFKFLLIDSDMNSQDLSKFRDSLKKELNAKEVEIEKISSNKLSIISSVADSDIQLSFHGSTKSGLSFSTYGDYKTSFIIERIDNEILHLIYNKEEFEYSVQPFTRALLKSCFCSFAGILYDFR